MKQRNLYILTRTPLHIGAGASVGAIDQPVVRERHTGFPVIPGSSVKGVLRDVLGARLVGPDRSALDDLFGQGGNDGNFSAGAASFGEARLVSFPVRSAKGSFAFATSALAVQRMARDAGLSIKVPPSPADQTCLAGEKITLQTEKQKGVVLEEFRFGVAGSFPTDIESAILTPLEDAVLQGGSGRMVFLSDGDLSHFAINACQVQQHVRINDETGTAEQGGLFNEEVVPSETLFYAPITLLPRKESSHALLDLLSTETLVQFGGGGTTGLGYCTVKLSA
jgi:CRISPR-associated protein Cmr4